MMASALFNEAENEGNDRHDGEDEEQNLGDFNRSSGYSAKAKKSRNKRDDQKNDGILQHEQLLGF
jgi:hypothetical protein